MDESVKRVMEDCTKASDEERVSFGEVVMKLMQSGVERYHADLGRGEKIYYMPSGESYRVAAAEVHATPSQDFTVKGVAAAVRAIQTQAIQYREFCEQIARAGCVGYMVSLVGRRAVYYGRTGDSHVEWFPGKD